MRNLLLSSAIALTSLAALSAPAMAEDPFIGQIKAFAFNFCPRNYAQASGQLLPIANNQALFSLYGTMYGGDGRTTFALPNLQGHYIVGPGSAQGGSLNWVQGQAGGQTSVTLTVAQLPAHNHAFNASSNANTNDSPAGGTFATFDGTNVYAAAGSNNTQMNAQIVETTGQSQPLSIRSPYGVVNYCVSLAGTYPSRN